MKTFTHFKESITIPQHYNELIESLAHVRNERGISQEKLAHSIGCTVSLIHRWETHKRIPSGFMLMCWLDALGYEIEIKKRES